MNDATSRTLFGVGVGPGDPELVTVKTVRILREADVILVPYTEATTDGPGRAESIITAVVPEITGRIRRIPFSMRERGDDRNPCRRVRGSRRCRSDTAPGALIWRLRIFLLGDELGHLVLR